MDSRGRVTLPKSIRANLKLIAGTRLVLTQLPEGTVILGAKPTGPDQPKVSVDDMRR
ncbi:AbrB/MazE/SpoVT family DNA-binding domain-containing protein [Duganella violaceipulchra]